MADVYTVTEEMHIWEQMPWDTPTSYRMFLTFYFNQKPPRSVNRAYRDANPTKTKTKPDLRSAPSNWRRWSQGKAKRKGKDVRLEYRILYEDGRSETRPIPTWEERAIAHDRFIAQQVLDKAMQARVDQLEEMQKMMRMAFIKTFQAWSNYQPGGESLGTLTASTQRLFSEMEAVFGGLLPNPDAKQTAVDETQDDPIDNLTDLQRVEAIADILEKVRQRRDGTKPT